MKPSDNKFAVPYHEMMNKTPIKHLVMIRAVDQ